MLVALKTTTEPAWHSPEATLERLLAHRWQRPVADDVPVLTDNFAPTDHYTPMLHQIPLVVESRISEKFPGGDKPRPHDTRPRLVHGRASHPPVGNK